MVLGGGCFWCLEAVFLRLEGVLSVESGYSGGYLANPDYESVCSGTTGHAEVVRVGFDPSRLPLDVLLDVFFTLHDPTTLNRQGHDVGSQYRSVIFYGDAYQEAAARAAINRQQSQWDAPIVTELRPAAPFYSAEGYHHDYYGRNGQQPYCRVVVAPKLDKLAQHFADRLRHL